MPQSPAPSQTDEPRKTVSVVYTLFLIGLALQAAMVAGVLIAFLKKSEVASDPVLHGHLTWLTNTVWLAAPVIAVAAYLVVEQGITGAAWLGLIWLWVIYRCVRGAIRFWKGLPVTGSVTDPATGP